ncbi:SMI1/KNR4 family protein [Hymenobacter terrestris]|uniref:SMI1/KNR4 family protein n=1 Tax=Hymenobacter terrestris TaxID=2748310 RepID=A0ABX2Q2K5_9BACT|nr:SMI1/KNR4 family protein [Hymenobacter terrestris]NVO85195.1 SMI1/KNR4 family protein [Hymenobacter terrestris]
MKELVGLIRNKHKDSGIDVNIAATISDITTFESQIGFELPDDFRDFFLTCNGFSCDEDIFNIIPLQSIKQHPQDYGYNWFYFAEYMIYSDMWGLRRTVSGQFEIFNGSYPDKTMTSSLKEFLQIFLTGNVFENGGLYEWHDKLGIK